MHANEHAHPAHAPRPKFDALFAEPRHYRGDLRLMRTAIRRGWLDDAPQADRDALVARFTKAQAERAAFDRLDPGRASMGEARAMIAMNGANVDRLARAMHLAFFGKGRGPATGRPRERWRVSDHPDRIDAHELRRRAKAEGIDLSTLRGGMIVVERTGEPEGDEWASERVALLVAPDARYGWRVWLLCPRCRRRRIHLYATRAGVRCRSCASIIY